MRHKKTLLVRIIYALFVGMSVSWALVVINKTAMWDMWQAFSLAGLGAAIIAFVGLRLVTILDTRWFIRDCRSKSRRPAESGNDPLVACQIGHREPYFDRRVNG